jgi:hypothetical protein
VGGFESLLEIDRPLAGNVIGYFDIVYLAALEILGDNVVSVGITVIMLASFYVH